MVRGRNAFMRTLEAIIAMAITMVFVGMFIAQNNAAKSVFENENILPELMKEHDFKQCILLENSTCINATLSRALRGYGFTMNISRSTDSRAQGLPEKRVFSESSMISGNSTLYDPRIIRVYYWR
ncbi:hypothetical protein HYU11_04805 [Candidatus Woesearchaeota archaeon]|nr:hypothetical protein [Candidatus Woesearchaeota archaeon]